MSSLFVFGGRSSKFHRMERFLLNNFREFKVAPIMFFSLFNLIMFLLDTLEALNLMVLHII